MWNSSTRHVMSGRYVLPEFTERTSDGIRTLDPYSRLLRERIILLGTPLDDAAAGDLVAQLMYLESAAPDQAVSLYINSPGGSFTAMTTVYDAMRYVTCEVETVCLGQAASTAALLLAAGTPGRRLALPHARVLIHQPKLAEPLQGQPSDLEIHAQELLRHRDVVTEILTRHTEQSQEQISQDIERDTVFGAQEALEYGLVDHMILPRGQRASSPALTRAEGEVVDRYLEVVDLLGRTNPARAPRTLAALSAAQGLVTAASHLRDALALMHTRGEVELYGRELAQALRVLDGERRTARVALVRERPQ